MSSRTRRTRFVNTNKAMFEKLVENLAPHAENITAEHFKPRVVCTCVATGVVPVPGFLVTTGPSHTIQCGTPSFNPDGSFNGTLDFCSGDFVVLGQ